MQSKTLAVLLASVLFSPQADKPSSDLTERVTRMARIGSVNAPSFSPDGRWLSVISNISGLPQVYLIPSSGGWPRMITDSADPVVGAAWAPGGDTLAITIAPGGGLNTQVYVVRSDGSGLRRLTDGKQDNNAFNAWSDDGRKIYIDSNRRDPAARDSFAIDVTSEHIELVARNPGIGSISNVTGDGRYALLDRVRSRGNNNLHLLDLTTGQDMVNFFTFFQHTQPWMAAISTIEYGDPATQKDLLEKLSPLGKLDRIRAAMMVQHGANDTNVPVVEAEQIVKHLKSRNVPVEYVLFPDEGHGWRKIPNRIRSTVEMVRFFDHHLNARAKTSSPR